MAYAYMSKLAIWMTRQVCVRVSNGPIFSTKRPAWTEKIDFSRNSKPTRKNQQKDKQQTTKTGFFPHVVFFPKTGFFWIVFFLFALVLIVRCFLLQTALHSLCCYSSLFRFACRTSDHTLVKCQNHGWKTKCCKSVCRMPKGNAGYSLKPHDLVPIDGKTPVGPHPPQNPVGWILAKAHRFHQRHVHGQVGCRCHPQPTFSELGEVHRLALKDQLQQRKNTPTGKNQQKT